MTVDENNCLLIVVSFEYRIIHRVELCNTLLLAKEREKELQFVYSESDLLYFVCIEKEKNISIFDEIFVLDLETEREDKTK